MLSYKQKWKQFTLVVEQTNKVEYGFVKTLGIFIERTNTFFSVVQCVAFSKTEVYLRFIYIGIKQNDGKIVFYKVTFVVRYKPFHSFQSFDLTGFYIKQNTELKRAKEAATKGVLPEKVFLEISQNSQKNTCDRVSFLMKVQAWVA